MILKGGFTNYGQEVGVLMLDTVFPRPRGDIGNAYSFDFPVRYKTVRGAVTSKIMEDQPDDDLIAPFIAAAKELEAEGVRAITTSCGFLAPFQSKIAAAVNIPVFTSALLQAPIIHAMLPPGKIIGVFTERGHHLNDRHFRGVGWSMQNIPIQIQGMKPDAQFPATYIGGRTELDTDVLKEEMLEMTRAFMASCPNPGAILFECTNMCPFSSFVAEESGLPVFDINTLIDTFYRAANPRKYLL
ncbi:MAG TPA: aspartate/glutamate racemase family protein [Amaricoccus sp.]|uniref:aspartate/glutamate racemase family protein n=1 Tax=Amaricoccus sp. TaxID=1872485 RepID=UPI002B8019A0|nr:aspartate/glutamate racemase family protein [Amaricoccus sp.]HMR54833.1 aspartate/glutamate racemase family protein [Amaricoccus sp.]HMU01828.1 aspartate/glutamate racemase family protein [Amaricoccus sp.]